MEYNVKPIDMETDFPLMEKWWMLRDFPSPNKKFLPKEGLIVTHLGAPVCGGFLFESNANIAIIGHLVSDPTRVGEIRHNAMNLLMGALSDLAYNLKYEMIVCSTNLPKLMGRFEDLGFIKTDENVSQFGRIFECH